MKKGVSLPIFLVGIILAASVTGVAVFLLLQPAPTVEQPITVTVALDHAEVSLDPKVSTHPQHGTMIYAMYNKLVEFDADMDLIPGLAESWSVAGDNVTWTFNLREGVSFHSGTPFNATHVVEHFETILANPGGPYSLYSAISNISAPDDNTVVMVTATPNAAILTNLAYGPGGIPNADLINSLGDDYSASADGTGAFELSSYTPGERIEFTANEDYWGGEPAIENLNFVIITDAASRNVAVQTGEVQLAESISLTDVPTVEANANLEQIILTNV
jgi:ABC-type transport system substrate-binding protein